MYSWPPSTQHWRRVDPLLVGLPLRGGTLGFPSFKVTDDVGWWHQVTWWHNKPLNKYWRNVINKCQDPGDIWKTGTPATHSQADICWIFRTNHDSYFKISYDLGRSWHRHTRQQNASKLRYIHQELHADIFQRSTLKVPWRSLRVEWSGVVSLTHPQVDVKKLSNRTGGHANTWRFTTTNILGSLSFKMVTPSYQLV